MLKCEGPVRPTEGLHLIKDDGNVKLPNSIQQIDEKATIPDVITTFSLNQFDPDRPIFTRVAI